MKCQIACLLLLWTLIALVSCATETSKKTDHEIKVSEVANGIKLSCAGKYEVIPGGASEVTINYQDQHTGEYRCKHDEDDTDTDPEGTKIFVKFRSCDNCIELDEAAIAGIVIGDVVATVAVGVAVYLVASKNRISPVTSNKKSSDRQHLVPNEGRRNPNDVLYQPLTRRQKDTYDVLKK